MGGGGGCPDSLTGEQWGLGRGGGGKESEQWGRGGPWPDSSLGGSTAYAEWLVISGTTVTGPGAGGRPLPPGCRLGCRRNN